MRVGHCQAYILKTRYISDIAGFFLTKFCLMNTKLYVESSLVKLFFYRMFNQVLETKYKHRSYFIVYYIGLVKSL